MGQRYYQAIKTDHLARACLPLWHPALFPSACAMRLKRKVDQRGELYQLVRNEINKNLTTTQESALLLKSRKESKGNGKHTGAERWVALHEPIVGKRRMLNGLAVQIQRAFAKSARARAGKNNRSRRTLLISPAVDDNPGIAPGAHSGCRTLHRENRGR